MINEIFSYEIEEFKKVKVQKCKSVHDVYGESLASLEKKYQTFTDFRFPKTGELVLCSPGEPFVTTWLDNWTPTEPRLIVGPKPKPRRVAFEEVRRDKHVKCGEFFRYEEDTDYSSIYYQASPYYDFSREVTVFKKLEDTGDSDPCQK
jgi:hypothetical protein